MENQLVIKKVISVCLVIICAGLYGCATIINGTTQKVYINSNPPGATVKVKDKELGKTPLTPRLSPKHTKEISLSLEGYPAQNFAMKYKCEWWWLVFDTPLAIVTWGSSIGVDASNGSTYRFRSDTVIADFGKSSHLLSAERCKALADSMEIVKDKEQKVSDSLYAIKVRRQIIRDSIVARENRRVDSLWVIYDEKHSLNKAFFNKYALNYLSWESTALLVGSYNFTYERQVPLSVGNLLIGASLGYKPRESSSGTYQNHDELDINNPVRENMLMPYSESYYTSLSVKYMYQFRSVAFYGGLEPFSRATNFDHVNVKWRDQVDKSKIVTYRDSLKANIQVYAVKVIVGLRLTGRITKRIGIFGDIYGGFALGTKAVDVYHYLYQRTNNYDDRTTVIKRNEAESYNAMKFGLNLGVRIGVRF